MPIEIARRRAPADLIPGRDCIALVRGFEGLKLRAYPDPASPLAKTGEGHGDPWTIGYGHTGPDVLQGLTCTLAQAEAWLDGDLREAADIVRSQISVPLTQGEFDALTSLAFNLGYIPRSLKACLCGGLTDKGVMMDPGSYGSALIQFPRNCRAAGIPIRGAYRRRLAEACVFSGLPWENACSPTLVQMHLKPGTSELDPEESTSLEDTLMRARQDTSKPPDVSSIIKKPWSEIVQPAPSVSSNSGGNAERPAGPSPQTQDQPVASAPPSSAVRPSVVAGPAVSETAPRAPPAPPVGAPLSSVKAQAGEAPSQSTAVVKAGLPPLALPPPKPESKISVPITDAPYRIDPNFGLKPMEETQRWQASLAQNGGMVLMRISRYGFCGAGPAAVATFVEKDPIFSAAFIALIGVAVIWSVGYARKCYGDWSRHHAERVASQAMV